MGKLDEAGVNNASLGLSGWFAAGSGCRLTGRGKLRYSKSRSAGQSDLSSCGCDERKTVCVCVRYSSCGCGCGWLCRGIIGNRSLDTAAAAVEGTRRTSSEEEKKLLWLPRSALPCPGQASSGCEAGRPLELSLEDSRCAHAAGVLPGGHGARNEGATGRQKFLEPTFALTFSRCQPTNRRSGQARSWQTDTGTGTRDRTDKTALFPLFRPQTSPIPSRTICPSATPRPSPGSGPESHHASQIRHRHPSGCLDLDLDLGPAVSLTKSIRPHLGQRERHTEKVVISPVTPPSTLPSPLYRRIFPGCPTTQ